MKLRDLFQQLSFEELSSLSIGSDGTGEIREEAIPKLINLTNSALLTLHTRFILIESEIIIQSLDWKSNYVISSEFSMLNNPSDSPVRYLMDTPNNRFKNNLIKILSVTNEIGQTLPLNDAEQYASVFTPAYNVVQITHPGNSQAFGITYQANHPKLLLTTDDPDFDLLAQEVTIPPTLETALNKKIAEKIYSPMSGQDSTNKARALAVEYELECKMADEKNLLGETNTSTNVKLHRRGFI